LPYSLTISSENESNINVPRIQHSVEMTDCWVQSLYSPAVALHDICSSNKPIKNVKLKN